MKVKCIIPQTDIDKYNLPWTNGGEYVTHKGLIATCITDNGDIDHPYNPENFEEVKEDIPDKIMDDDMPLVRTLMIREGMN